MDALKLNQAVLTFIGVCATDANTALRKKIQFSLFYALMLLMYFLNIIACGLYFIKYISTDYDNGIYALLAVVVLVTLLYILIDLRYHSLKLRQIFETLYAIYERGKISSK